MAQILYGIVLRIMDDARGEASVLLNQEASKICFAIVVSDITLPATAAHIHVSPEVSWFH